MADSGWTNGGSSDGSARLSPGVRDEFSGATVLLVDDDNDIRDLLTTMLELAGFVPTACSSAEAALEELREQSFDLVLTDYMLPHRTGAWLLDQATAEGLLENTPALIITAHPRPCDVDDYEVIQKPFDLDHLVSKVKQHLDGPTRRPRMPITAPIGSHGIGDGHDGRRGGPVELILYVNSASPQSLQAIQIIERVVSRFSADRVTLTVHDLSLDPGKGAADAVVHTPTLVRRAPPPRMCIMGPITNPDMIAELIDGEGAA